jgi:hypothetical protein
LMQHAGTKWRTLCEPAKVGWVTWGLGITFSMPLFRMTMNSSFSHSHWVPQRIGTRR